MVVFASPPLVPGASPVVLVVVVAIVVVGVIGPSSPGIVVGGSGGEVRVSGAVDAPVISVSAAAGATGS